VDNAGRRQPAQFWAGPQYQASACAGRRKGPTRDSVTPLVLVIHRKQTGHSASSRLLNCPGTGVAQKITVEMTDDLDGSEADTTARFAVDGTAYEIDLSKKNAMKLRQDFGWCIEHARKSARGRTELADAATWLGQFASCEAPRTSTSGSASAGRLAAASGKPNSTRSPMPPHW
jgi:Lsr2